MPLQPELLPVICRPSYSLSSAAQCGSAMQVIFARLIKRCGLLHEALTSRAQHGACMREETWAMGCHCSCHGSRSPGSSLSDGQAVASFWPKTWTLPEDLTDLEKAPYPALYPVAVPTIVQSSVEVND